MTVALIGKIKFYLQKRCPSGLSWLCENISVGSTPMYEFAKTNVEESRQLIEAFEFSALLFPILN